MSEFWQAISVNFDKIVNWIPVLLKSTGTTLLLTLCSVSAGLVVSVFLALGKMSKLKILSKLCSAYIFFFRGTPLLMQLFVVYYGLPYMGITIDSKFFAAFLAYAMNSSAYLAEIIRAAIQSIDKGQLEAAKSLGMSYPMAMRLIIIPQSIRRLIPPIGNEFIMIVKDTALVSSIALVELSGKTKDIMIASSSPLVFVPALAIYLLITGVFTFILNRLEKRFSVYE
ncbi:MAG: amino acid ABC transporter permease [Clostridiales bacterium]|nr:amino acid ABC transporter permease [Clostridiales bacterium]